MAETLTQDQRNALSKLRSLLKEDFPSSMYEDTQCLVRFLKARDYNVKKAESMIRKNARWQKEIQLENLITDYETPEVLTKYYPISFLGYDKDGCPVEYMEYENLDEKGFSKAGNFSQLRKFFMKTFEMDIKYFKQRGSGKSPQLLYIHNVAGITLSRFLNKNCCGSFYKIAMEFQDNYPEHSKNIIVINATPTFAAIWSAISEWLGSALLKKILIYGKDGWKEELLKRIDADVLPAFLGGNKTDPDGNPLSHKTVNHGGTVPDEYYSEIDIDQFLKSPGAATVRISRQKEHTVPIEVTELNSVIKWEFFVTSYDIGFGISLKTSGHHEFLEEVIPVHKVETERVQEYGMYRCKHPGNYIVIFDNPYSWVYGKEVLYRIWITSAD